MLFVAGEGDWTTPPGEGVPGVGAKAGAPDGGAPGAPWGVGAGAVAGAEGAELAALVCANAWPAAVLKTIAMMRAMRMGHPSLIRHLGQLHG